MNALLKDLNEHFAEQAFSRQAPVFDDLYASNTIVHYKRRRVRAHMLQYLKPNSNILELNSGTGDDALFFAYLGHTVHATDISAGMQQQLVAKVVNNNMQSRVSNEQCSFNSLHQLKNKGPYQHVFSNFAGLNCTGSLNEVLLSLPPLVAPGGIITLAILPKFCLWETLLVFKGKFKTATRRWFAKNGLAANVEGVNFLCWYYNAGYVERTLKNSFRVLSVEGICSFVPPSYIEGFAEKYPVIYRYLVKLEHKLKQAWPWCCIGDYYIISLQKK